MWLDKYKKETTLINTGEAHNKFWSSAVDENTNQVTIRWGRIGTKGQQQVKDFDNQYGAIEFVRAKQGEKNRKGYHTIDKKKFDELSIQAAIVGASNKCRNFRWVEIIDQTNLKTLACTEDRLQNPDCNPGLFVEVETKKEYNGRHVTALLFTFSQVYDVTDGRKVILVTKTSPIYELTNKVEEALGRTLA